MAWKKSEGTKHSANCTMAFGKLSQHGVCPRCEELRNGAASRSWNIRKERPYNDGGLSKPCINGGQHTLNAGGYCNNCSAGRDHS